MHLRVVAALLALVFLTAVGSPSCSPVLEPPPWPEWALRHWVWENEGDQASALELVDGYLSRDIPVGAQIIDRPWEVEPTAFRPDPARYPDLAGLVDALHARDVRLMLWAVSMINENAELFAEAKQDGYLVSDGELIDWWGGRGAFLDYTNPEAVAWWHARMDAMLDLGIDGWKVDGTDPLILFFDARGLAGPVTRDQYRDAFYRDFFEYTRARLGPDRIITARPVDSLGLPVAIPYAPPDVNFAGWVGDQDGDWGGLAAALLNMRFSSELGYVNFGSDVGGFRGGALRDRELFVRWAQLGALSPILENGGGGEHRPWLYDAEVTDVYRRFVKLHHELIPYLYGQGAEAWQRGVSLMRFESGPEFRYQLGDDLFVAPILAPDETISVTFPPGTWRDWLDESAVYEGGTTHELTYPLDRYPVFVRDGAIVPLDVRDDATGHGAAFSAGHLTAAVYPGAAPEGHSDVYEETGPGVRLGFRQGAGGGKLQRTLVLWSTRSTRPLLWRVHDRGDARRVLATGGQPRRVASVAELARAPRTWTRDADGVLWVRIADPERFTGILVLP